MEDKEELTLDERLYNLANPSNTRRLPNVKEVASFGTQVKTSLKQGLDDAVFTGVLPDVLARNKAGSLDEAQGLKPLTKDQFDSSGYNFYGDDFKHDPKETPSQTQLRFNRFVGRVMDQQNTSGGGILQEIVNFGANMATGLIGDAPFAVVPYGVVASRIRTAGTALRRGMGQAAKQTAARQAAKAAAYEEAVASGSKFKAAAFVSKDFLQQSVVAAGVETAIWGAGEQYVSQDVTMADMAMNGGFSVLLGQGFNVFAVRRAWQEQGKVVKFNEDIDAVSRFLENGETTKAAFKLADFYEPAKKVAKENEEFAFLLQDVDDINKLTPDQVDAAARFQQMVAINELKGNVMNQLLSTLASDTASSVSQEDLRQNITEQIARIYDAIDNNQHLTLADEDWQVLVKSGWDPSPEDLAFRNQWENSQRQLELNLVTDPPSAQLTAKFTSARYSKNGYELSSSGDARFSAFRARLKDGRTVEKAYQEAKGSGKGQPAKDSNFDYYGTYLKIWKQWAKENPDLIEDLRQKAQGKVLTDKFANTENNQARALADILNETQPTQPTQPTESGQLTNVIYKEGTAAVRAAEAAGEGINVLRKKGTDEHYGNPFSHLGYKGTVKTADLLATVFAYRSWLEGTNHTDVHQAQRQWILTEIDSGALDGKKLLYYDESVQPNHATALAEFIQKRRGVKSKPLTERGKDFVNHSGGARGADDVWGTIGEEYGITSRHYYVEGNKTPKGNTPVTQEQANAADSALVKANETLQRTFPTSNTYVNNLLRRNYYQVVNSDAVFAITEIKREGSRVGIPQGGTGWAVQMAVDMGKPVAVFSQDTNQWFSWDSASSKWLEIDTPTLTKNFAGIGTRNLNTVGRKAIKQVYAKTFKPDIRSRFTKIGDDPSQFAGAAMLLPELGFEGKVTFISDDNAGFQAQHKAASGGDPAEITFNLPTFLGQESAIPSAMHELVHFLGDNFKPAYQQMLDVVNNNARLRDELFNDDLWKRYNRKDLAYYFKELRKLGEDTNDPKVKRKVYDWADERHSEEGVAWFVTEASRHPEFWKGMHAANPTLFNELRDWFVTVWENVTRFREKSRHDLTKEERTAFYDLGVIIGAINNSGVSKPIAGAGSLDPTLTHQNFKDVRNKLNETFNSEQIDKPKPQQSELALEAEETLNRNLNESGSLNNDRSEFFINETNTVLGNPTVLQTILSTPEGYNAANDKGAVARKAHVRTVLEQNGLENYSDIAETIIDIASRKDFQESLINGIFDGSSNYFQTADLNVKGLSEELKTSIRILLSESNDMSTARTRVLQSLNETFDAEVLRAVRNGKIQNDFIAGANQFKNPKQRIEWIQSQLDGQQRSGFNPQASANVKSKAQIVVDAKPINDVLEKHGLWDVFIGAGHGPYLEVLRKQTGGNPDAIKIYGKDLRANVNAFAADLMVAMRTGETPTKWKGSEAFEELVDAIKKVRDSQLVALNRFGSNVRVLDNFSGWSQRWSNATIRRIGFDQFRKDMLAGIDWDATSRAHGDVLTRENGKDIPFDREAYLKEWYYRITELKETLEGGDVARSFEQSRMVHLKADAEAKLLAKYSGEGNLGKLLMDQIRYRSEMIASLGFFGSEPLTTIQKTLDAADLRRGDNVGKFKYDTVLGTTKLLINELDNPVDVAFASIFKNVRKVGNLAFLPLSGFSALMDIPLSVATLKYTGAEIGVNEFMPQFIEAMSRQFKGDKSGMTAYFRDVGAAYDVVNNANVRQITGDVSGEKGLLDIAMSFMFEANGMLRITAAGQEAFADWTSRSLGKDAASGKFNDLRLESLRNFGFTDAEIDVLLKSASKDAPDGISRIMPQTIEDANVSNKLREYYLHYMKQAVLEPDAGAQAITRGNFKDGTVGGVVMRTGFQYTSFILGLSRVIFNRFANGYTGSQLNHVRAMSHLVAFVGTSLATAWFVTAMKDLAKGRAPINPTNMSSFDWQRIVSQSGLVGIGEMPLELLEGSLPLSPIAKAPIDLAAGVLGRDGKKTAKAIAPFAGGSLPIVGGPIKAMLGMAFTESAGSIVEAEFDYLQKF